MRGFGVELAALLHFAGRCSATHSVAGDKKDGIRGPVPDCLQAPYMIIGPHTVDMEGG
jgi:hypothetical protein